MNLLQPFEDGQTHEVDEKTYAHFLGVLPPVMHRFEFAGESWGFGFAEGADYVYAFKKSGDRYFARKTDILNPEYYGAPEQQAHRMPADSNKQWLQHWLRIGRRNEWIKEADDPPFTLDCFHECAGVDELIERFTHGNWCLGQAFTLGDLCFINQVEAGDEWLAIKRDTPFDSISFGWIIEMKARHPPASSSIACAARPSPNAGNWNIDRFGRSPIDCGGAVPGD